MYFDLCRPCKTCPFRADVDFRLRLACWEAILHGLMHDNASFACHNTTHDWDDDEPYRYDGTEQFCAGALLLIEREGAANALVQIAERFGWYNPQRLDRDAVAILDAAGLVARAEATEAEGARLWT